MNAGIVNLVKNKTVAVEDNPILQGNFAPVSDEVEHFSLKVQGKIPKAINGLLLRNGPNPVDPQANHHWFVGDAMLHAIAFENGKASSYRNRWVRTTSLEEKKGLSAAPISEHVLPIQGSGNVNVIQHGGQILALPELGLPYAMNTDLSTQRMYDFDGKLASSMTAHPKIDPVSGELLFFGYELEAPFLRFHIANPEGKLTKSINIDLPKCVMMHDFGVTASRVIFMDLPIIFDMELAMQGFNLPFRWEENHQARLGILDRSATSDEVLWIDIDPCYVFHPMNCYDDGNKIVMDVVRYEKAFTSQEDISDVKNTQLVRWVIDPELGTVSSSILLDEAQEFPRVNPKYDCYPNRFGYSLQEGGNHGFKNLIKYDFEKGSHSYYDVGDNNAGGEPIFVSTGEAEDEGYILSVIYNGDTHTSEVHIIDAQAFDQPAVAIIELGARVPFGFHGNFVQNL